MEQVEATLFDGEMVVASDVALFLEAPSGDPDMADAIAWHAHATLPLGLVLEPGSQLRLETDDGRSGFVVVETQPPDVEGARVLHVFTGVSPLERQREPGC